MNIKKYLLAVLLCSSALLGPASLFASDVDEAALAAATELALAPAKAAADAGDENAADYLEMLQAQGSGRVRVRFFHNINVVDGYSCCTCFCYAFRFCYS